MYLGIDLGTSAVKVLLVGEDQQIVGQASAPLTVDRPRPLWSEQDPEAWWRAVERAMAELHRHHGAALTGLRGIGLAGQMHGATLLDAEDRVLRPAILWNDGRSAAECAELERRVPESRGITGNLAMPGFTAPKLLWVQRHEPEIFAATARVLLPKDFIRLRMTGASASDMSDAAGTLWLDVGRRHWSGAMLEATGLDVAAMPELFEGSAPAGTLLDEVADRWGVPRGVPVAGGAGDNAAGAVGAGAVTPGSGFVSLGTSGVIFEVDAGFLPNPERAVHAFCHCLPGLWHRMAVMLSAASCLSWLRLAAGDADEEVLLAEAEAADLGRVPLFLPYLAGERTPHNDPDASGAFIGLTHGTGRGELARAVVEGVALALADCQAVLHPAAPPNAPIALLGGGSRSLLWAGIIADGLRRPVQLLAGGEVGPAFGAARLARLAVTGEDPKQICTAPAVERLVEPKQEGVERMTARLGRFRALDQALREERA